MLYTIYKITNNVNSKIYIGVHKTSNISDAYMGSGIAIKNAIKKYGKENFTKDILFIYENKEDAYKKEQEIVNQDFINSPNTYNGKLGGKGGWDHVRSPEVQELASINKKKFYQSEQGKKQIAKLSEMSKGREPHNKGKPISDTQKRQISEYRKSTMWITNGEITKVLDKNSIIPDGWYRGRSKRT